MKKDPVCGMIIHKEPRPVVGGKNATLFSTPNYLNNSKRRSLIGPSAMGIGWVLTT